MCKRISMILVLFGMTAVLMPSVTYVSSAFPTMAGCGLLGDLNEDGKVDVTDIMMVTSRWNSSVGDDDYNPAYDLDSDGGIDIVDIMLVANHWGETCPTPTPTSTPTATPTSTPTTPTPTETPTITPTPTFAATWTPTSVATDTATPTSTSTSTSTHTPTDTPTVTNTPTHTPTPTETSIPTVTPTPTETSTTPMVTHTPTDTPTVTNTPTHTATPTTGPTSTPTPTVTPTCSGPAPPIFGVTGPVPAAARQLAREADARWLRTGFSWASVEPSDIDLTDPANGNWPDSSLRQLVDEGFTPILLISTNPGWAVETIPSNHTCGPLDFDDLEEFQEFMRALAERYDGDGYKDAAGSPVVEHFEMYNEPEKLFTHAWTGCWAGDGHPSFGWRYAEALSYAWRGAHDGNPNAKVLFGGMGAEEGTGGDFDRDGGDWLDDVLGYIQANPGDYFDWMNIHTYWAFRGVWAPWGIDIIGKVNYFRQVRGIDEPMVVTETTLPSNGYGSDALQSRYAVQVFVRSLAVDVKATTWHRVQDIPWESAYGLLDVDGNPKMSYWAYKTTTDELAGAEYVRVLTSLEDIDSTSGIEGYVFTGPSGSKKMVLWYDSETTVQRSFPVAVGGHLRVVEKQKYNDTYPDTDMPGSVREIADGSGEDLGPAGDGKVTIQVTASPIFVQNHP